MLFLKVTRSFELLFFTIIFFVFQSCAMISLKNDKSGSIEEVSKNQQIEVPNYFCNSRSDTSEFIIFHFPSEEIFFVILYVEEGQLAKLPREKTIKIKKIKSR